MGAQGDRPQHCLDEKKKKNRKVTVGPDPGKTVKMYACVRAGDTTKCTFDSARQ